MANTMITSMSANPRLLRNVCIMLMLTFFSAAKVS